MAPGPHTALPDLDAPRGAGSSAASADAGLGIFAPDSGAAGAGGPAMTTPLIDPTLGGRRRPVGVASGAATTDSAVVPIRAVLGGRSPRPRVALPRLRRQMGVAALTMVTLVAGFGSAWTVRAVFAHVPHTQAPAVWRMETHDTPADKAGPAARTPATASPAHSAKATHHAAAAQLSSSQAGSSRAGSGVDTSGRGSVSSSSGHQSRRSSGHKTSGRTASPSPTTEVHHRKGRGTGGGTGGVPGNGGADDPATHDTTPTIGVDDHGGGSGGAGGAGNGGGGGGGGTGLESGPPAVTPSALPTTSGGGSSGTGSGSSGGGGGGGGGHDDFVAGG